jgi:pimeloyl-ACP methyl ester carboxylesterase
MDKFDLNNYKVDQNEFKTANVNGHIITYNESKNREKKHILFIHGIGASLFGWRDIPDALSEQFHTISIDLIGFGGSDKPENTDYTVKGSFSTIHMNNLRLAFFRLINGWQYP